MLYNGLLLKARASEVNCMPIYQYRCGSCGVSFEQTQSFSDEPLQDCPECDGEVHRVIQPVGIIFKGSGFYVTDNRRNTALLPGKRDESSVSDSDSDSDSTSENSTKTSSTEVKVDKPDPTKSAAD